MRNKIVSCTKPENQSVDEAADNVTLQPHVHNLLFTSSN